jgi:hypothetical protein
MDEKALTEVAVEVSKTLAKDLYNDAVSPAAREAGGALAAVVGLFNNVVLYPFKHVNLHYKYKLEQFEQDLKAKLDAIPPERVVTPDLQIAGPTLEALKYTYDTAELREMYLQLLASAMDSQKASNVHPSFVDVIKSMSAMDAHVFAQFPSVGQLPVARVSLHFEGKTFSGVLPTFYAPDLLGERDPFQVSTSIQNLVRLGLLTHRDNKIMNFDYDQYRLHPFLESRRAKYQLHPEAAGKELTTQVEGEVLLSNDFGRAFRAACLPPA